MCIVRSAAWQEGRYDIDLHRDGQRFKFTTLLQMLSLSLLSLSGQSWSMLAVPAGQGSSAAPHVLTTAAPGAIDSTPNLSIDCQVTSPPNPPLSPAAATARPALPPPSPLPACPRPLPCRACRTQPSPAPRRAASAPHTAARAAAALPTPSPLPTLLTRTPHARPAGLVKGKNKIVDSGKRVKKCVCGVESASQAQKCKACGLRGDDAFGANKSDNAKYISKSRRR